VNPSNLFAHSGEVKVGAFDHPGGKLYDLFRRKTLLRYQPADNHLIYAERSGGLLHGDPHPLIGRWTSWNAVAVSDMLHALLRPGVVDACAIAQPVQNRNNLRVCTD